MTVCMSHIGSPAPLELKQPHLHQPMDGEDIDLNMTVDIIHTPNLSQKKPAIGPTKKMCLEPSE